MRSELAEADLLKKKTDFENEKIVFIEKIRENEREIVGLNANERILKEKTEEYRIEITKIEEKLIANESYYREKERKYEKESSLRVRSAEVKFKIIIFLVFFI